LKEATMVNSFTVNVAELLRRPATQKDVHLAGGLERLQVVDSAVEAGVRIEADLVLESLTDGIVVSGVVRTEWEGACRRCLEPVVGPLRADVHEVYRPAGADDDAYTFSGEQLDLAPMVREVVLLELPLAPLCRSECAGLCPVCGANRNEGDCGHQEDLRDPRWAALEGLLEQARLDHPES
jgi:uncharacterized protein